MIQIERDAYNKVLSALQTKNEHMIAEAITLLAHADQSQSIAETIDAGAVPRCPKCGSNEGLKIIADCLVTCWIDEEWSVQESEDGDLEWNGSNEAQCSDCDWFGKVRDLCSTTEE